LTVALRFVAARPVYRVAVSDSLPHRADCLRSPAPDRLTSAASPCCADLLSAAASVTASSDSVARAAAAAAITAVHSL